MPAAQQDGTADVSLSDGRNNLFVSATNINTKIGPVCSESPSGAAEIPFVNEETNDPSAGLETFLEGAQGGPCEVKATNCLCHALVGN
jgi:hypothetical protein